MASMKWIKPSQATLDYFERIAPGAPLETRKMFGMPCRFLNGYVLVGVFQNTLMLHLSDEDRAACMKAGAEPFEPMGREMKSYVAIRPGMFEDHDVKWWIVRGMRYLASLEPRVSDGPRSVRGTKLKAKATAKSKAKAAPKPKAKSSKKVAPRPATKKAARKAKAKPAKAKAETKAKRRAKPAKPRPTPKKRRGRR